MVTMLSYTHLKIGLACLPPSSRICIVHGMRAPYPTMQVSCDHPEGMLAVFMTVLLVKLGPEKDN